MIIFILKVILVYFILGLLTTLASTFAGDDEELDTTDYVVCTLLWPAVLGYTIYIIWCTWGEDNEK